MSSSIGRLCPFSKRAGWKRYRISVVVRTGGLFIMRKLLLSCSMALAIAPMALLADQITGYVSDAHCGAAHSSVSDANTKCINKCLDGGSDPVLVSEGKVK